MKSLLSLFPRCSKSFQKVNHDIDVPSKLSDPKPQPHKTTALDGANERETGSVCRVRVRFTGFRVKPLDPDNFAGSCKDLLDGLRHSGLISGDEPWRIIFETEQEKVSSYTKEKTVVEIDYGN